MIVSSPTLPVPQQDRSRRTAERFIAAALELLQSNTFAELSVAEIAAAADRSVGAFYQRFGSKDEFLEILLAAFFERGCTWAAELEKAPAASAMFAAILTHGYEELIAHRNLWHAALQRSAVEPGFWGRFESLRQRLGQATIVVIERSAGRPLDNDERQRLAVARQVFNSVVNNQIINAPGPLRLEDREFLPELLRIALQIASVE